MKREGGERGRKEPACLPVYPFPLPYVWQKKVSIRKKIRGRGRGLEKKLRGGGRPLLGKGGGRRKKVNFGSLRYARMLSSYRVEMRERANRGGKKHTWKEN